MGIITNQTLFNNIYPINMLLPSIPLFGTVATGTITGITDTPDARIMFVDIPVFAELPGIQYPNTDYPIYQIGDIIEYYNPTSGFNEGATIIGYYPPDGFLIYTTAGFDTGLIGSTFSIKRPSNGVSILVNQNINTGTFINFIAMNNEVIPFYLKQNENLVVPFIVKGIHSFDGLYNQGVYAMY